MKVGRLIHVKVNVNRFLRDQRSEHAGGVARSDQIAAGDQRPAGAAIDRRGDFGEIQVELRDINRRLCGANIGLRLRGGRTTLLPLFTGDNVGIDQLISTVSLTLRKAGLGFGSCQVRLDRKSVV